MMNNIILAVSQYTGVDICNILSRSRKKSDVFARHVCMYIISKKYPRISQEDIAGEFGVSQSSVSRAVELICFEIGRYSGVKSQVDNILHGI